MSVTKVASDAERERVFGSAEDSLLSGDNEDENRSSGNSMSPRRGSMPQGTKSKKDKSNDQSKNKSERKDDGKDKSKKDSRLLEAVIESDGERKNLSTTVEGEISLDKKSGDSASRSASRSRGDRSKDDPTDSSAPRTTGSKSYVHSRSPHENSREKTSHSSKVRSYPDNDQRERSDGGSFRDKFDRSGSRENRDGDRRDSRDPRYSLDSQGGMSRSRSRSRGDPRDG